MSDSGAQANARSSRLAVSANGRYVAFTSYASNLVPDDTNDTADVFVRDLAARTTRRVSVSSREEQANWHSGLEGIAISPDGRYVAFISNATNLVRHDTNHVGDVFVRDRWRGTTRRVSVSSNERQANGWSQWPVISPDGRYVAYQSDATNLVAGDTNRRRDVFLRDRDAGRTERISVTSTGGQANGRSLTPVISDGAHRVVFVSSSTNLSPRDRDGDWDVFVRDRDARTTRLVSVRGRADIDGIMPAMSTDGRHVAFEAATQVVVPSDSSDIWVRDLDRHHTQLVSANTTGVRANSYSWWATTSSTGRSVAFMSFATNLVPRDTNHRWDVFVRDRRTGTTKRVSLTNRGRQSNGWSGYPSMSGDGRYVAFLSRATNLVPSDTNGVADVFVRDASR